MILIKKKRTACLSIGSWGYDEMIFHEKCWISISPPAGPFAVPSWPQVGN